MKEGRLLFVDVITEYTSQGGNDCLWVEYTKRSNDIQSGRSELFVVQSM
jgi:hypothetical protein